MYIVIFKGSFGFIKPWGAVRDSKTKSWCYLTPSILMGIERKLFPELSNNENGKLNKILRYRLSFQDITWQQETTRSINYEKKTGKNDKKEKYFSANTSIISRGILVNPILYLMFETLDDAKIAFVQHICLGRNEDVMLATELIETNENDFDDELNYSGYESFICNENDPNSVNCGYNRYTKKNQYMTLKIIGTPINLS